MKLLRHTAICVAFSAIGITSTFAQHVVTDFDHQANFSKYKTYSWQEIKPPNSLWDSRIKNAVDAQLSAKGWTSVNTGGDVAIVAINMTSTQRTLQTFYDNFGAALEGAGDGVDSGLMETAFAMRPQPSTTIKTGHWSSTRLM